MTHYGIWWNGGWLRFGDGQLFFTTSYAVAKAMLEIHGAGQILEFTE